MMFVCWAMRYNWRRLLQTDGQIVIPLLPYSIMEYANDKLDTQQKDKLLAMLRYIGEEQNPVLMIIKM